MSRIGIFGGSFNPVHNGHIALCKFASQSGFFDKILIIPDNLPPHKSSAGFASGEDRLNMLALATEGIANIELSDIELNMGGISYTVNTLKSLCEIYPQGEFFLIIGSDMFFTFKQWYEYENILKLSGLYVAARNADDFKKLLLFKESFGEYKEKIFIVKNDVIEISSTEVRNALAEGKAVDEIPQRVYEYIKKHKLYTKGS